MRPATRVKNSTLTLKKTPLDREAATVAQVSAAGDGVVRAQVRRIQPATEAGAGVRYTPTVVAACPAGDTNDVAFCFMVGISWSGMDLADVRFAVSPLNEMVLSLRAWRDPGRYPLHLRWLHALEDVRGSLDEPCCSR